MTFDELETTLQAAVMSEKIGTPVALRVHGVSVDDSFDAASALGSIVGMAVTLFDSQPARLTARADVDARQWNVLLTFSKGETVLFSVAADRSQSDTNNLHLVLIGNHGIIRLEGGELFTKWPEMPSKNTEFWKQQLNKSHEQQTGIDLSDVSDEQ